MDLFIFVFISFQFYFSHSSNIQRFYFALLSDFDAPKPDPFPGVGPAVPGRGAEPGEGRPGSTTAGGNSVGTKSGCRQDPTRDHYQVLEGHTG